MELYPIFQASQNNGQGGNHIRKQRSISHSLNVDLTNRANDSKMQSSISQYPFHTAGWDTQAQHMAPVLRHQFPWQLGWNVPYGQQGMTQQVQYGNPLQDMNQFYHPSPAGYPSTTLTVPDNRFSQVYFINSSVLYNHENYHTLKTYLVLITLKVHSCCFFFQPTTIRI